MLRIKKLKRIFLTGLKIALVVCALVMFYRDVIVVYIKPPLLQFVNAHSSFLLYLSSFIFVSCSLLLILIVWWLDWGDRRKSPPDSKYISQLVCKNYYGDYKKVSFYRAIKTSLSKFSRASLNGEEDTAAGTPPRVSPEVAKKEKNLSPAVPLSEQVPEDTSDGLHRTFYKGGQLEKEVTYKDKKLHGDYRTYYEDGKLHQEKYYQDGKLDGIFRAYDEEGVLYFEIAYKDGKQNGITKTYFKTGILQYQDTYKDGVMVHRNTYSEVGEQLFSQDY